MNISLVGLGNLGLPLISCFTKVGYKTLGIDINRDKIDAINQAISPINEPGLQELISKFGGRELEATTDHSRAITETDVTFILTSTPSLPDGSFSNEYVESAIVSLAKAYADVDKGYHLFVISSTVVPESTTNSFIPLIEKYSGKKLNKDFGVVFDPDFVALGQVIKDFQYPDFVLIGESDRKAGDIVENIHKKMCLNNPQIFRMSIINAEIAKVCLNTYITLKISFANSIANLCEKIPGADCDVITSSIGYDKRISPYYFSGGLSFGGPCFPRDTQAFVNISAKYNESAEIISAVTSFNDKQDLHLSDRVFSELSTLENKTVGIIGLAFKEGTPSITGSPSITLIQKLLENNINVVGFDSLSIELTKRVFGDKIEYTESPKFLLEKCGLVVLMIRSQKYKSYIENFSPSKPTCILDCWRIIDVKKVNANYKTIPMGRWIDN